MLKSTIAVPYVQVFFIYIKSKIIKFYKYQRIDVNVMINSFCEALKE